jgi:hypothetical protein
MKTLFINLFGGPGAGKSTAAWDIAAKLKKSGKSVELVAEYAKELVYEKQYDLLDGSAENQRKIFEEQCRREERLIGQVNYAITDSPVLLQLAYLKDRDSTEGQKLIHEIEIYTESVCFGDQSSSYNLLITRGEGAFEQNGRIHSETESIDLDKQIEEMLSSLQYYETYSRDDIDRMTEDIQVRYASWINETDETELNEKGMEPIKDKTVEKLFGKEAIGTIYKDDTGGIYALNNDGTYADKPEIRIGAEIDLPPIYSYAFIEADEPGADACYNGAVVYEVGDDVFLKVEVIRQGKNTTASRELLDPHHVALDTWPHNNIADQNDGAFYWHVDKDVFISRFVEKYGEYIEPTQEEDRLHIDESVRYVPAPEELPTAVHERSEGEEMER